HLIYYIHASLNTSISSCLFLKVQFANSIPIHFSSNSANCFTWSSSCPFSVCTPNDSDGVFLHSPGSVCVCACACVCVCLCLCVCACVFALSGSFHQAPGTARPV